MRKRAVALRSRGAQHEALEIFEALHHARPGHPPAACDLAATLRQMGEFDRAEGLAEGVLETAPGHVGAHILLIANALDQGDVDGALSWVNAALATRPDEPKLQRRQAFILRRLGRQQEARAVFEDLHRSAPDNPGFACDLAVSLRQMGEFDGARALTEEVLVKRPGFLPARRLLYELARMSAEHDVTDQLLAQGEGTDDLPLGELFLRIDHARMRGDDSDAQRLLAQVGEQLDRLSEGQLTRLLLSAQRLEAFDLLARIIRHIPNLQSIKPRLALVVLRISHTSEHSDLSLALIDCFAAKMGPAHEAIFREQAALILKGPYEALATVRATRRARRSPVEARRLAGVLMAASRRELAIRYLRFCLRKWPNNRPIRAQLMQAYIKSGFPETGAALLETVADRMKPEEHDAHRIALLVATGRLKEAAEISDRQVRAGQRAASDPLHLRLMIFLGRNDEAQEAARKLRVDPARRGKKAAHFWPSHLGALLTELQLYKSAAPANAKGQTGQMPSDGNFFASHGIVQRAIETEDDAGSRKDAAPVPRRIVQYWNHPNPPPEIARLMEGWKAIPGWDHVLHDKYSAKRWLRATLGHRFARAFSLARHVAEESDFLRLCLLLQDGGIYADTDDALLGNPEGLLAQGGGLVVFTEPHGAILNNVICAPPRHPVIRHAVQMAGRALLRGDNENTWSKTGPGLLTRAVARHIAEAPAQAALDTTILRDCVLRRHVSPHSRMPYKGTAKYWNSNTARMSHGDILSALSEFTQAARDHQGTATRSAR
jgi:mannosyltransferase OCH1-like enzyme/predicted Zn-dependent protease